MKSTDLIGKIDESDEIDAINFRRSNLSVKSVGQSVSRSPILAVQVRVHVH